MGGARAGVARIGVATCGLVPDLDEDGPQLLAALTGAGLDPRPVVWDDPAVDWQQFDGVLIRSVWDYPARREEFLAWSRRCRITANPQDVVAWNTDKRYLEDLSAAGVQTVATRSLAPGQPIEFPEGDFVVKPSISGSAADTGRFHSADRQPATTLINRLHAQRRTVMVQPYLTGIDEGGETSMVFLGGQYSHAMRRAPLLSESGERRPVVVADVLATVHQVEPTPTEFAVAQQTIDAAPGGGHRLSYARVDLIPGPDGPVLLELEATDCFLFLSNATTDATQRLAAHVRDHLTS